MVKIDLNAKYRLANMRGGTYMTISASNYISIIGQAYTSLYDQVWTFESAGQASIYCIKSLANNRYLAVPVGPIENGEQLKALAGQFERKIEDVPESALATRIRMTTQNKCIDLSNGLSADGTPVQLWDPATGNYLNDQVWVLEKDQ